MSRTIRLSVFVVALLSLVLAPLGYNAAAFQTEETAEFTASVERNTAAQSALPLAVAAPASARVGELVTFTVRSNGAQGVAGFQFALNYDDQGLDFYKAEVSDALRGAGYDVLEMGPVRRDGVVHFGAVACPVADCASDDYSQPRLQSLAGQADVELARLQFYVRAPGSYTFGLSQARMVAESGASLAAPQSAAADLQAVSTQSLDLTQNLIVNDADAYQVIGEWAYLLGESESGACIAPAVAHYDLDGSGCLDVGDAQAILSHWGESVSVSVDAPAAPESPTETNAVFTVNSDGDQGDASPGNGVCATAGGSCTLRAAIQESNVLAGADTINFNILGAGGACPALVAIQPTTTLTIDGGGLTINGYTQCGASANSQAGAGNAVIKIELRGNQTVGVHGLNIASGSTIVRGLAIFNFNSQILIRGARSHHNVIDGNFIGTNAASTLQMSVSGESFDGLDIELNAYSNLIGGTTPATRNLISGNDQDGLNIQGPEVNGNLAINNFIGLRQDGVTALRNQSDGVDLAGGTYNNIIGGLGTSDRNVISGNGGDGVEISHDGTHDNHIVGNFIGVNVTGNGITRNQEKGVTFEDIVENNRVYRNVIAGNGGYGVRFYTADNNQVYDNFIGVRPIGVGPGVVVPMPGSVSLASLVAAGNGATPAEGTSGVFLLGGSQRNLVRNNVIANHPDHGIGVSIDEGYLPQGTCETWFNTFSRNFIYSNGQRGIRLFSGACGAQTVGGNQSNPAPLFTSVGATQVTGTACPNCVIEVFISDKTQVNSPDNDNFGEGKQYVGTGVANAGGVFMVNISGVAAGQLLTATATSASGNTSEFARNTAIGSGSPGSDNRILLPLVVR